MTITGEIAAGEHLGRGVFSSRNRSRARRGKTPHHVFLERGGEIEISVDRLDIAPAIEATEIADHVAANRSATFYGWAVVVEERARAMDAGRSQLRSPAIPTTLISSCRPLQPRTGRSRNATPRSLPTSPPGENDPAPVGLDLPDSCP